MISKQSQPGDFNGDFSKFINELRKQNSSNSNVALLKKNITDLNKKTDDVRISVDKVQDGSVQNAKMIVDTLRNNASQLEHTIAKGSGQSGELVDINYQLLLSSLKSKTNLDTLVEIQLGGREGLWGKFNAFLRSFRPFSSERQRRVREKQSDRAEMARSKLLRLSFIQETKAAKGIEALVRIAKGTTEGKEENKRFLSLLLDGILGREDGSKFNDRDRNNLGGGSGIQRFFDAIPGGGLFLASIGPMLMSSFTLAFATMVEFVMRAKKIYIDFLIKGPVGKAIKSTVKDIFKTFNKFFRSEDFLNVVRRSVGVIDNIIHRGLGSVFKFSAYFPMISKLVGSLDSTVPGILKKISHIFFAIRLHTAVFFQSKVMTQIGAAIKNMLKGLPFVGRIGKIALAVMKFVPFLNILVAGFEAIRGAFKGYKEIGGLPGILIGIFGGLMEFVTLGIFDMETFLNVAKDAVAAFKDGRFLDGVLLAISAPIDGIVSGIKWLVNKIFSMLGLTEDGSVSEETGLLGQMLYYSILPYKLIVKGVMWLSKHVMDIVSPIFDKISTEIPKFIFGVRDFFSMMASMFGVLIEIGKNPVQTALDLAKGINPFEKAAINERNSFLEGHGIDMPEYNRVKKFIKGSGADKYKNMTEAGFSEEAVRILQANKTRNAESNAATLEAQHIQGMTALNAITKMLGQKQNSGGGNSTTIVGSTEYVDRQYNLMSMNAGSR